MAKMMYSPQGPELLDALRAMGIDPNDTVRVVFDIRTGHATMIYVERMADERIIDVVRILANDPHARVDRDPTNSSDDDWSIEVRPQDPGIVHVWCGNAQLHDAAPLSARAARLMGQQLMIAARKAEQGT